MKKNDEKNYCTIPIADYILPLLKMRKSLRLKLLLGSKNPYEATITAFFRKKENGEKELVILEHSPCIKRPGRMYKRRWKIESYFKRAKTAGFNLESTHLRDPVRLERLFDIVQLATAYLLSQGKKAESWSKRRAGKKLSLFRICLNYVIKHMTYPPPETLFSPKTPSGGFIYAA